MKKVITYGTFDMLHYGHIRLLERAKKLGDYLIVGVTSDSFDKRRGKINVRQSLIERVEAVKNTGLVDEVIIEEYEGQKIDDIKHYDVDIFAIGSDWTGKFDYLKDYCTVVYLERTTGISSSQIRSEKKYVRVGYIGDSSVVLKYINETENVNGLIKEVWLTSRNIQETEISVVNDKDVFFKRVDACFLFRDFKNQFNNAKEILSNGKHLICGDLPCAKLEEYDQLKKLANDNNLIFMTSLKTAYSIAYHRLILLIKSGMIGEVVEVRATCTSKTNNKFNEDDWKAICEWGPTALLPIFQILGTEYKQKTILSPKCGGKDNLFTKIDFCYGKASATMFVSKEAKSDGCLVVSGTNGYIYVPSPWWKTNYFEVCYEKTENNQKFFFQLDGEGIGNVLLQFYNNIASKKNISQVDEKVERKIVEIIEECCSSEQNSE